MLTKAHTPLSFGEGIFLCPKETFEFEEWREAKFIKRCRVWENSVLKTPSPESLCLSMRLLVISHTTLSDVVPLLCKNVSSVLQTACPTSNHGGRYIYVYWEELHAQSSTSGQVTERWLSISKDSKEECLFTTEEEWWNMLCFVNNYWHKTKKAHKHWLGIWNPW